MANPIVVPSYLNRNSLPYASDIFYHGKITYFMPTGFVPQEIKTVFEFPEYCRNRSIALPNIIWEMCKLYFENDIETNECADILEHLRKDHITLALLSYPRNIEVVDEAKNYIQNNLELFQIFRRIDVDIKFAARELLSHVLYEVVLEKGEEEAVEYIKINSRNINDIALLIAAVIMNRVKLFISFETILIYEHDWYPLITRIRELQANEANKIKVTDTQDSERIEAFGSRLFGEILNPIYGRCDSKPKSKKIGIIAKSKIREINELKEKCEVIAREVCLLQTKEEKIKQKILRELIIREIEVPLSEMIEKPTKQTKVLLRDFLTDSGIIAGILMLVKGGTIKTLTTALEAGILSSGIKYIINNSKRETLPSDLLIAGMKNMKVKYKDVQNHLNSITLEQLNYPKFN